VRINKHICDDTQIVAELLSLSFFWQRRWSAVVFLNLNLYFLFNSYNLVSFRVFVLARCAPRYIFVVPKIILILYKYKYTLHNVIYCITSIFCSCNFRTLLSSLTRLVFVLATFDDRRLLSLLYLYRDYNESHDSLIPEISDQMSCSNLAVANRDVTVLQSAPSNFFLPIFFAHVAFSNFHPLPVVIWICNFSRRHVPKMHYL